MTIINKLRKARGFTLVELMIVVVIIGILASLAIYGVNKYIASSKSAEARLGIGAISKGAAAAYEGETMQGTVLALGASVGSTRGLCSSASNTVPDAIAKVKGMKYQSGTAEWSTGSQTAGWTCLKFSMTGPQYYMYGYDSPGGSTATVTYSAFANGDLDGDGKPSTFSLRGELKADGTAGVALAISPSVIEDQPAE